MVAAVLKANADDAYRIQYEERASADSRSDLRTQYRVLLLAVGFFFCEFERKKI